MNASNRNTLWVNIFVDELARAGLRAACIAPGSRSTPLTLAFARHPDITVYSLLDERGAAFFALGLALVDEQPAALVCTSGTAAANFYPALIEADAAQVPLLLLTTDRPPELRHSGANQTIDQVKLYGDHVRWFVDVALPEADPPAVVWRSLRTLAARALAATQGLPPGPVHLNFPFRKPLEPTPVSSDVPNPLPDTPRPPTMPFTRIVRGQLALEPAQSAELAEAIRQARRGLIICGPRCPGGDFPAAVSRLARAAHLPVLADALSGVRFGPHIDSADGLILGGYETFLQPAVVRRWSAPDLILRFGAMPISKMLGQYLGAHPAVRHVQVSSSGVWQDDSHTTSDFVWTEPAAACIDLASQLEIEPAVAHDDKWRRQFEQAEQQVWQSLADLADNEEFSFFEGLVLPDLIGSMPPSSLLFSASSLPVRHLDQFVGPKAIDVRVLANRGASGIDGTIAGAAGAAAASGQPLVLVCGDLAFYHDLNSLLAVQRSGVKLVIVLINNHGGGIFHRLPIANFEPLFTELFVTPPDLDFEPLVRGFGLEFVRAADRAALRRLFAEAMAGDNSRVIEITTDAQHHETMRRRLIKQTNAAIIAQQS